MDGRREGFVRTVGEVGGTSSSLPENLVWVQWNSGVPGDHERVIMEPTICVGQCADRLQEF